ncbi:unnamed protein product [Anisakis simplex]|uniref:Uncharacterized protein n=1 Tax=Anisakis simplex TaxID=6269 RepID=A0A3P6N4W5_ANISI|nr:unnamed protein product [Anisakis simplex]
MLSGHVISVHQFSWLHGLVTDHLAEEGVR